jgi:hypothetical protein
MRGARLLPGERRARDPGLPAVAEPVRDRGVLDVFEAGVGVWGVSVIPAMESAGVALVAAINQSRLM